MSVAAVDCSTVLVAMADQFGVAVMKLYWSEYSIPELSELPRPVAREVWVRCLRRRARFTWQFWLGVLLVLVSSGGGAYFGSLTSLNSGVFAGILIGMFCGFVIALQVHIPSLRRLVIKELRDYRTPESNQDERNVSADCGRNSPEDGEYSGKEGL